MKNNQINIQASVIVVNFNNEKYVNRCLNSLHKQNYKNFEVIFVDDSSTDNSIISANKFFKNKKIKKYKLLTNTKKSKFGSFNQISCILKGLKYCNGDIILFLDSDDFFKNSKIKEVIKFFKKNNKTKISFDLSYNYYNQKTKIKNKINNRSKNLIPWPSFSSQSCISVKKNYLKKIIKSISIKKYPDIGCDFRLISKGFYDFGKINHINKHLTYYQQNLGSVSQKFSKYSNKWWARRSEAHKFINNEILKNKKTILSLDYYLTNLINLFFIKNVR